MRSARGDGGGKERSQGKTEQVASLEMELAQNVTDTSIPMSPAPDPRYTAANWWKQEHGLIDYPNEYLKFAYDFFKYRMIMLYSLLASVPRDSQRFARLCGEVKDWDKLLEEARRQGVSGVLWYHLADPAVPAPSELKQDARRQLVVHRLAETRLRAALTEAAQAFDAAEVPAAALKGPALGDRIYPSPGLRPASDLDFLVRPTDLDRALAALAPLGYKSESTLLERYYRENHHHVHLGREGGPPIELHFRATSGFGTVIPANDLISRATRTANGSWLLSPEDEFLYLAIHAARHLFEASMWLYDLKLFVLRRPDLDWNSLLGRASAWRVTAALGLALGELHRRLEVDTPPRSQIRAPNPWLASLGRPILKVASKQEEGSLSEKVWRNLYRVALCDRPAASLWQLRHRMLRFVRRRARRYFPAFVPRAWSR